MNESLEPSPRLLVHMRDSDWSDRIIAGRSAELILDNCWSDLWTDHRAAFEQDATIGWWADKDMTSAYLDLPGDVLGSMTMEAALPVRALEYPTIDDIATDSLAYAMLTWDPHASSDKLTSFADYAEAIIRQSVVEQFLVQLNITPDSKPIHNFNLAKVAAWLGCEDGNYTRQDLLEYLDRDADIMDYGIEDYLDDLIDELANSAFVATFTSHE